MQHDQRRPNTQHANISQFHSVTAWVVSGDSTFVLHGNWSKLCNKQRVFQLIVTTSTKLSTADTVKAQCPSECIIYQRLLGCHSYQHVDTMCNISGWYFERQTDKREGGKDNRVYDTRTAVNFSPEIITKPSSKAERPQYTLVHQPFSLTSRFQPHVTPLSLDMKMSMPRKQLCGRSDSSAKYC